MVQMCRYVIVSSVSMWLQCYMNEMTSCSSGLLPVGIAGREDVIFGNIVEIHEFHKKWVDFTVQSFHQCFSSYGLLFSFSFYFVVTF